MGRAVVGAEERKGRGARGRRTLALRQAIISEQTSGQRRRPSFVRQSREKTRPRARRGRADTHLAEGGDEPCCRLHAVVCVLGVQERGRGLRKTTELLLLRL